MKVVLLPGLDGTGRLFAPLLRALPGLEPIVVSYPCREVLDVQGLLHVIEGALPTEPYILVAESFSGPLAVRVAARRPLGLRGLVLVASFVRSPLGRIRPADPVLFNDVLTTQSSRREARDADDETSVDGRMGDARGRMAA